MELFPHITKNNGTITLLPPPSKKGIFTPIHSSTALTLKLQAVSAVSVNVQKGGDTSLEL